MHIYVYICVYSLALLIYVAFLIVRRHKHLLPFRRILKEIGYEKQCGDDGWCDSIVWLFAYVYVYVVYQYYVYMVACLPKYCFVVVCVDKSLAADPHSHSHSWYSFSLSPPRSHSHSWHSFSLSPPRPHSHSWHSFSPSPPRPHSHSHYHHHLDKCTCDMNARFTVLVHAKLGEFAGRKNPQLR